MDALTTDAGVLGRLARVLAVLVLVLVLYHSQCGGERRPTKDKAINATTFAQAILP